MRKASSHPILARLLCLVLLCALMPMPGLAENAELEENDILYLYNSNSDYRVSPEGLPDYLPRSDDVLTVYCFDTGSMDAFLIVMDGEAVMLDSGGGAFAPQMLSLMDSLGIRRLKAAINTHPHSDHIDGFDDVLSVVPANVFYTPFNAGETRQHDNMMAALKELGIPVLKIDDGDTLTIGRARLDCYRVPDGRTLNERSLVTRLTWGERSMLFTADIENNSVKALAELHGAALKSDVLKLPHHGQVRMATEFLEAVSPCLAIVTNGRGERSAASVNQMKDRDIPCLYTVLGMVELRTDGAAWYARQFANNAMFTPDMLNLTQRTARFDHWLTFHPRYSTLAASQGNKGV